MRRLILQERVTIDDFAADLNGGMDFQEEYSAKKTKVLSGTPRHFWIPWIPCS
jgi:hypothetical protein